MEAEKAKKIGERIGRLFYVSLIALTAVATGMANAWWVGAIVFFALISLHGIHSELIRHRPKEK